MRKAPSRLIILSVSLLAACGSAQAPSAQPAPAARLPEAATVLDAAQVGAMLRQCSRASPAAGEGGWRPGAADILALEAALPAALAGQRPRGAPDWSRAPQGWLRQYVGIVRGGRRYIYGNFIPHDLAMAPDAWRREPAVVCDGGPAFFGAEYDVAAGRFTHLAFNGMV